MIEHAYAKKNVQQCLNGKFSIFFSFLSIVFIDESMAGINMAGGKILSKAFKSKDEAEKVLDKARKAGRKSQESKGVTNPEVQKLSNPPVPQGMTKDMVIQ
ncbi:hypothetical protein [Moraxella cuniculi]|uniref:Uncharacterized protein n=1 Tax=Moraxella cuniculi TaxID=34061 RepID=A0A3S4SZF9_9GAMM|nr:hypothetical protein [Moraxella cuniculi]VEG13330.1 Uncharacterised protein [Moraxella cuniculi]